MQGVRNVLAHERLFLPTVDTTIDFLRIAHGRIMPYLLTASAVMSRMVRHCLAQASGGRRHTTATSACVVALPWADFKFPIARLPGTCKANCAAALPYNLPMHTYTVSLRIESRALDTAQVTRELDVSPTQTRAVGERRDARTVWEKALWEFEVFPDGRSDWDSLEIGLAALLEIFSSHTRALQEYSKNHDVYIWCGLFSSGFAGGPHLSAETLKRLGDFGIPLWLDTYSKD